MIQCPLCDMVFNEPGDEQEKWENNSVIEHVFIWHLSDSAMGLGSAVCWCGRIVTTYSHFWSHLDYPATVATMIAHYLEHKLKVADD